MLALDTWRQILAFHPYHFWQLANPTTPITSACNGLVKEYAWQSVDAVGRSEIREAIQTAEDRLAEYLGFAVAPRATSDTLPWPHLSDRWLTRINTSGPDGRYVSLTLREGYVQAVGADTLTLLGTPSVALTDRDGDGLNDTFTIVQATTVTDPSQIEVYFAALDRLDGAGYEERYRIAPVSVSIAGGLATITGRAWLIVRPVYYEGVLPVPSAGASDTSGALDPANAGIYAAALDVVQHTTDPNGTTFDTAQATLIWETRPCVGSWCLQNPQSAAVYGPSNAAFDPAAQAYAVARVGIRDAVTGIVTPAEATRDATTGIWAETRFDPLYAPDRVQIRYRAGYPLASDGQMDHRFRPIVARLAAAELSRPIAACDAANRELYRWQLDLARGGGRSLEQFQISPRDLDNPLGTRAGQVYAWKQIQNLRRTPGFIPG